MYSFFRYVEVGNHRGVGRNSSLVNVIVVAAISKLTLSSEVVSIVSTCVKLQGSQCNRESVAEDKLSNRFRLANIAV